MYCPIDEFLGTTFEKSFWFCQYPRYCFYSEIKKRCHWCLFYGDMFTFYHKFTDLTSRSKTFKVLDVVTIFIRIIGYWLCLSSNVVNDVFDLLPTRCHSCIEYGFLFTREERR